MTTTHLHVKLESHQRQYHNPHLVGPPPPHRRHRYVYVTHRGGHNNLGDHDYWFASLAMAPDTTVSWFVAASEFCSKSLHNLFYNLTSCFRLPEDCSTELSQYHANIRGFANENRDSMGLLAAIFTGRESKARELVALPWTNINAQYANGNTPLILAVQGGNEGLVRLLLDHPMINVNIRGLDGYTALIRAVAEKPEIVSLLVARPDTDVNLSTYYGTSALTYAIRCGNDETVQILLSRRDLDVNFQSRHGENALIESVTYRRYDVARALISRPGCEVDVLDCRDRTPLIMAAQYGCAPLVRLLLFSGADPFAEDDHGRNALYYALRRSCSGHNSHSHNNSVPLSSLGSWTAAAVASSVSSAASASLVGSTSSSTSRFVAMTQATLAHCEMVHDLMEAMSAPQSLARICRMVIRRVIRARHAGYGNRLKPSVDKFKANEVPKPLKRFLAYDP